jgi:hypothetical protein
MNPSLLKKTVTYYIEKIFPRLAKKSKPLILIFLLAVFTNVLAQQITVRGKVTAGDSVLAGVTVSEKNIPGITARQTTGRPGASTDLQIRNLGSP